METLSLPQEHRRTNLVIHTHRDLQVLQVTSLPASRINFEVRCKLRKVGEYEIERLHRAMLVERDPESLRNLARQLTKALEERIKTLGEQRQSRPNN